MIRIIEVAYTHEILFSVIIPSWNRLNELMRAVDSVINQTLHEWELIIVEDGSENQGEIVSHLSAYEDQRIRVLAMSQHHNAAYARNKGIEMAKGEWISFLDSDDYFALNKLSRIKETIETDKIDDNTIIYSQFIRFINNKKQTLPTREIKEDELVGDYLFTNGGIIGTPGIVMSRTLALEIKFDPSCIKHQDYDLLLRAEQAGARFYFIQKALWIREYRMSEKHVGAQYLPGYSCHWYNQHSGLLSTTAAIGFLYIHVFDLMVQRGKLESLIDIFRIIKGKNYPRRYFSILLTTLLPYAWYIRIRFKLLPRFQ